MNAKSNNSTEQYPADDGQNLQSVGQQTEQKSSCLLLALNESNMLVPRALVAEVIKYSFVEMKEDEKADKNTDEKAGLRKFEWRGCQVPMVPTELLGSLEEKETDDEARVIIFYGLRHSQSLPFYAVTVTKSPQLLQLGEADLEENIESELHTAELMKIRVQDCEAFIPKIDYLENATLEILQKQTT